MSTILPTILEIGPGRGDLLFHLARERPHVQIAAIEYKRKRFEKLVARAVPFPNVCLYLGNAREVLPQEFGEETLEEIYLLFPDPWPKRRHAKHRLIQRPFVESLLKVLKPAGKLFIATDDVTYHQQIIEVFMEQPGFVPLSEAGFLFPTLYAQRWQQIGRQLLPLTFQKQL